MSFGLESLFVDTHQPATRGKRAIRGIIVAMTAIGAVVVFGWLTRRAQLRSGWRATPCQIVDSSVEVSPEEAQDPYRLHVFFAFEVGGVGYSADSDVEHRVAGSDAAAVYAEARAWPAGLQTTCYVNPAQPPEAVLARPNLLRWEVATAGVTLAALLLIVFYSLPQITRPAPPLVALPQTGVGRLYIPAMAIACLACFGWSCVWPLMRNAAAASWMPVPASVEHARLSFEQLHGEVPLTLYRTDLLYRYQVGGVEYHSNRYSLTEIESPLPQGRRKRVAQLATLAKLYCYVDPRHPESAVLSRRISPTQGLSIWPAVVGLLSIYLLIPRRVRYNADAALRRSRWTIASVLLLLAAVTAIGLIVMP